MLWKILLTAGLILAAYLTLKARLGGPDPASRRTALPRARGASRGLAKGLALAVLAVMALGWVGISGATGSMAIGSCRFRW